MDKREPYISGYASIANRQIPLISTKLSFTDWIGGLMVRFDIGRGNYRVSPGLYGIGKPD